MWGALDENAFGCLAVGGPHRRHVAGQPRLGGAEPAHRLAELAEFRAQIIFTVPVAEVAGDRGRRVAVERPGRAAGHTEYRGVHELGVVTVGIVLGQ